jgi:hypothetical protein
MVQIGGKYQSIAVWDDEEDSFDEEPEEMKKEHWDEKLVVGSGWLYRRDMTIDELAKERKVVGTYLDVVDEVLFEGKKEGQGGERGWERIRRKVAERDRKGRKISTGDTTCGGVDIFVNGEDDRRASTRMLGNLSLIGEPESMADIEEAEEADESLHDEELPDWAQRATFLNDDLGGTRFYHCFPGLLTMIWVRSRSCHPISVPPCSSSGSVGI